MDQQGAKSILDEDYKLLKTTTLEEDELAEGIAKMSDIMAKGYSAVQKENEKL